VSSDAVVQHSVPRPATVARAQCGADSIRLSLPDGRVVELRARPDAAGSRRVHGALRRVERVDLTIDAAGVVASVTGIGHRRRSQLPVSLPTALALVLEGAPTTVTVATAATAGASS
jgi:hypothetical protein